MDARWLRSRGGIPAALFGAVLALAAAMTAAGCAGGAPASETASSWRRDAMAKVEQFCDAVNHDRVEEAKSCLYDGELPGRKPVDAGSAMTTVNGVESVSFVSAGDHHVEETEDGRLVFCEVKALLTYPLHWSQASGPYNFFLVKTPGEGWRIFDLGMGVY